MSPRKIRVGMTSSCGDTMSCSTPKSCVETSCIFLCSVILLPLMNRNDPRICCRVKRSGFGFLEECQDILIPASICRRFTCQIFITGVMQIQYALVHFIKWTIRCTVLSPCCPILVVAEGNGRHFSAVNTPDVTEFENLQFLSTYAQFSPCANSKVTYK